MLSQKKARLSPTNSPEGLGKQISNSQRWAQVKMTNSVREQNALNIGIICDCSIRT